MHILYLTHDLSDPTTTKRVRMLLAGGATVTPMGFHRGTSPEHIAGIATTSLGTTHANHFLQRILAVLRGLLRIRHQRAAFYASHLILARNLETLALAVFGRTMAHSRTPIVYEVLDIHRLLLREDIVGRALRWLEGWLSRRAALVIVSSPAFVTEYLESRSQVRLPHLLLENKVYGLPAPTTPATRTAATPWRIGWFGVIRCRRSVELLRALTQQLAGKVEVIIRGQVAYDQIPEFDALIAQTPGMVFHGRYANPDDLARMYGEVHFTWAIDWFEAGMNSRWLLPNRIYEGGLFGSIPLALDQVETGRYLQSLGIGHCLTEPEAESLRAFFSNLTPEHYQQLARAVVAIPTAQWLADDAACVQLVHQLSQLLPPTAHVADAAPADAPLLVVIPCLNEAAHLESLITYLLAEAEATPMTIVIADGGSTDGTVEIAKRLAQHHANVQLLHNPKRIQSAAVNLAVATYGEGHRHLLRLDAHAHYPAGYAASLLRESAVSGADSIVVHMHSRGARGFQRAVALAQNSALGNGGSAHRTSANHGQFVEHGHHALMRIAAFCAVGGYDETFTHNEDAELDARLRAAGFRLWLTGATAMEYYPRSSPRALFRQYVGYGRGRVRNLLRHRHWPRLRQALPVAVFPALLLALFAPLNPLAALPLMLWALLCLAYGAWLAYQQREPAGWRSGLAAMVMHGAWSLGFWHGLLRHWRGARA